ncbi:MAG: putative DNA binding domain-containing protein [Ruminococcus sp.]|nr:putative DNA binding domain-containing protein [Ruminococcus sp.]
MDSYIPQRETMEIEFKSDVKKLNDNDLIDAVVAFANTAGGVIYLGVENDGTPTGVHKDHKDYSQLPALIANRTVPPVSALVEPLHINDKLILKINVPKSRSIVASSVGKIQRRTLKADGSPENIPMYPHEITTRLSSLSLLDFSAQPVPGALYVDLDPIERERLRNIIRSYNGEKALLELSDEELDKAMQFVITMNEQLVPTYTGLLMLGRKDRLKELIPTAESAFIMMRGTEVTANESYYLPLLASIERMIDFVSARNPEQEIEQGLFRISIPEFNPRAVREAIVNAFAHRDYTQLGRVLVKIDGDGLTVSNPGGFIEGVTYQNILTVEPHGRNPVLADALKRVGLAERSGRGVDRIFEGSLIYGRELPDYSESTATSVRLFIPRGMPDKRMVALITEEQQKTGQPISLSSLFVLNALKHNRRMSLNEISSECNIPESKLRSTVEQLTEAGIVDGIGNGRGRVYVLSAKAYKDPVQYVRQTDIDVIRYSELILKLAQTKGSIARKDVIDLLHVSGPQAFRLLKKLEMNGKLIRSGNTSAAKYSLPK